MRKLVLGALLSVAFAGTAEARDKDFYVGAEAGVTLADGDDLIFTPAVGVATTGKLKPDYKPGFDGAAVLGYDFGRVRVEAEASYRSANVDKITSDFGIGTALAIGTQAGNGKASALSFMGNAMLDLGKKDGLSVFIGGGAGYAKIKYDAARSGSSQTVLLYDEDWSFAWQGIVGVRHPISDKIDVSAKYRFFNAKTDLVGFGGRSVEGTFRSHSLMVGVTFNFL